MIAFFYIKGLLNIDKYARHLATNGISKSGYKRIAMP